MSFTPAWVPPPFAKIGKASADLFKNDFPDTYKVEVETASESGLSFVTCGERKSKVDKKTKASSEVVYASIQPKLKIDKYGIDSKVTLDNESLLKSEITINELFTPGLKATIKTENGKSHTINAGFEYSHELINLSSTVNWKSAGDTFVDASLVTGRNGFSALFQSTYFFQRSAETKKEVGVDTLSAGFNYAAGSYDFTSLLKREVKEDEKKEGAEETKPYTTTTVFGKLFYSPNKETKFAAEIEVDPTKFADPVQATKVKLGATHNWDATTTNRCRFDTDGKLALSVSKQLHTCVGATLGTEINTFDLTSPYKMGFALKFKF